jgi:predicted RNA-binding Zn-ribbon protein involved in translation (DUF1610 family)
MMNFEKCFCASCGQRIEYPAEGTGQTVQCPTCGNAHPLDAVLAKAGKS